MIMGLEMRAEGAKCRHGQDKDEQVTRKKKHVVSRIWPNASLVLGHRRIISTDGLPGDRKRVFGPLSWLEDLPHGDAINHDVWTTASINTPGLLEF